MICTIVLNIYAKNTTIRIYTLFRGKYTIWQMIELFDKNN